MMNLPFSLELMDGKGDPLTIDFRRATPEDIDNVLALQDTIVENITNKDIYATYNREETLLSLNEDICFAAEHDGKFIAYSVLIPNSADNPRNYGNYMGYDRERLAVTASLDLTMVAPGFRGRGIQRIFNKLRIGAALETGAKEAFTTISPDNPYSYRNFLVLNFEIVDTRTMYGGKERYILHKYL